MIRPFALILTGALALSAFAETATWTVRNYTPTAYTRELVHLGVTLKEPYTADTLAVTEDGAAVPCQVEVLEGTREAVTRARIWVCTDLEAGAAHTYEVSTEGPAKTADPLVKVTQDMATYVLDNGMMSVLVPAGGTKDDMPAPVMGIKPAGREGWLGAGSWQATPGFEALESTLVCDGALFARVKLRYTRPAGPDGTADFAEFLITLAPGRPAAMIEESHRMAGTPSWRFAAAAGWTPAAGLMRGWRRWGAAKAANLATGAPAVPAGPVAEEGVQLQPFAPSSRTGDALLLLQPRFSYTIDLGWFHGVIDGTPVLDKTTKALTAVNDSKTVVGVVPARAGKWQWPYDNLVQVRLNADRKGVSYVFPTVRGRRCVLLFAGPRALAEPEALQAMVTQMAVAPLDKMAHEFQLDWEGKPSTFAPRFPFAANDADPTAAMRRTADKLLFDLKYGTVPVYGSGSIAALQGTLDPDAFGGFSNGWSPIYASYATDLLRLPLAQCVALKEHPRFAAYCKQIEQAFRTVLEHSVTIPGGAGQECTAGEYRTLVQWLDMADICRDHLGFNPYEWPQIKAACAFLLRTTVPIGGERRILPLGDTSYPGVTQAQIATLAERAGVTLDVTELQTEELPGFGVMFHDNTGTAKETTIAFKAGPNRARMHGDQLSFHYVGPDAGAPATGPRRLAIDHMSASPRAIQEHMHNRVAFAPVKKAGWEFANMDGYERLIAFKTSPVADVAIGQVESSRLRQVPKDPRDVVWQSPTATIDLDTPLIYRRTMVLVKGIAGKHQDYVVIRDQHWGPEVTANFCLHVSDPPDILVRGGAVDFGRMTARFVTPATPKVDRVYWSHNKPTGRTNPMTGQPEYIAEKTGGIRVPITGTTSEFLVVLYPGGPLGMPAIAAVPNGIQVSTDTGIDRITFAEPGDDKAASVVTITRNNKPGVTLTAGDVDLNRSQGSIGLFIAEPGSDFGPVPAWLEAQRTNPVYDRTWEL